jgi:SNF2 family DNA or RNA helicase
LRFLQIYPLDNQNLFNHHIGNPIKSGDESGIKKLRLLVNSVSLRRTKDRVTGELHLRPRIDMIQKVVFTAAERRLYDVYRKNALLLVDSAFADDGKLKSFCHILQVILRLRQICNHGADLLPLEARERLQSYLVAQNSDEPIGLALGAEACEICGAGIRDTERDDESQPTFSCLHVLCTTCVSKHHAKGHADEMGCPLCTGVNSALLDDGLEDIDMPKPMEQTDDHQPSSKVLALLQNLHSYRMESTDKPIKRYDPSNAQCQSERMRACPVVKNFFFNSALVSSFPLGQRC